jgi:phosphomannomutase
MKDLRFGTDGWRAVIAEDFTVENVARMAHATALWALKQPLEKRVVIGHDCRFGGEMFAEVTAKVLSSHGIKVILAEGFVSTPMVSLGVVNYKAMLGVVITASHNPPLYNGYKLKGHFGGPLMENYLREIEALIPRENPFNINEISLEDMAANGLVQYADLETMYCCYLQEKFDIEAIRTSGLRFAFDAMYGSGQNVMRRLFPAIDLMHCERKPLFDGIAPEPLLKNLREFSQHIVNSGNIDCGLAVDGDADRIALFDSKGNYIDSHHVILLLIHYLNHYKKMTGMVATGFSSTVKINKLCKQYGLPLQIVKIGFKHISNLMLTEDILVGGEESGGIAVAGHIPERDGIYCGLVLWEAMVKTGKSIRELIEEIYSITGSFAFERSDLSLPQQLKDSIVEKCRNDNFKAFGDYKVEKVELLDGFKYYFSDSKWFMIRPSGTEPLLRTYAEGESRQEAFDILKAGYETIMKLWD